MPTVDREAPLRFLRTAFQPDDWIAIFLKSYETGHVNQRVGPVDWGMHPRFQAWLATDPAATPATQTSRLVGYYNHKYSPAHLVTIDYSRTERLYTPADFPPVTSVARSAAAADTHRARAPTGPVPSGRLLDPMERARRYLARVPPAIAGQHGDVHTFRVCCRLVRGFALEDDEALRVLSEWNARCQPPWRERELQDKLRRARRYGHEPIGALLHS